MVAVQDRTAEFRAILTQAQKKQGAGRIGERKSLLSDEQRRAANGSPIRNGKVPRGAVGKQAAEIARGITATMEKLQRLAELARKRSLFDDKPLEVAEMTYIIKQDLVALNSQLNSLQALSKRQQPSSKSNDNEGEHNKNVLVLLQSNLADVSVKFKDVLEIRTRNIQESRQRKEAFVSSVSSQNPGVDPLQSQSPLYNTPTKSPTPSPGYANSDLLNLEPSSAMSLPQSRSDNPEQQALMLEEGPNSYLEARGSAIESIERTINELGGIFGQLAQMVSEQGQMVERIDADTEDVVDNVEGAQRELLKYFNRVSSNRWLIAKMFGVLMIFFLIWVLIAG